MTELLPCRFCGNACRIERFEGGPIEGVLTIYMCANSTKLGGDCPDPHAYMNVNAWNTAMSAASVDDEMVERMAGVIDPDAFHESVNPLPKDGLAPYWMGRRAKASLKARSILALAAVKLEGVGEP